MNNIFYSERFASHPRDVKNYDTGLLRKEFLIESLFEDDKVILTYSGYDRFIVGGAVPKNGPINVESIDPLKADYFCERREMGIINLGGLARINTDSESYDLGFKEAIYITRGTRKIVLESINPSKPAFLYLNSAPAHKSHTTKIINNKDVNVIELGDSEHSNKRRIRQYIVPKTCSTCQLVMGMTELEKGSVWNTMPPHTHNRRMEVYLYTDIPDGQAVCHFMGQPDETRHIWLSNNQAVISPNWSIHSAAGTSNYTFIWGMSGENMDFSDMDLLKQTDLR